ncbi:YigZ family protein [Cellulomonas sp. PS-H5]|uniref:IMPACT family protein n=1 Tax=Cellulomonas sp. PS-H5 TaxID=2820400 RepID=UPI001C4E359C|nr:YigZ family protein [Cellulomonas sp. PS-H5]MBW0252964.1 YigZ family protein [Cellulomonas sp. PS-H5]
MPSPAADPAPRYPSTIAAAVEHELVIKKSRFLALVQPVSSVAEADAVVAAARKRYWDARHHCVALSVGPLAEQQRSTDDGEPSGTAGVPMLEVLRRRELTDLVAVVSRYFGGVLLGAGGLVRAYSTATSEALDRARLVRRSAAVRVTVDAPHADAGRLHGVLRDWAEAHEGALEDVAYGAEARFALLIPPPALDAFDATLAAATSGALRAERGATVVLSR